MKRGGVIPPFAGDDARRSDVIARRRCGLDYIDVHADGRSLSVAFFGRVSEELRREQFVIDGGDRVRDIRVTGLRRAARDPELEGAVTLQLDRAGDASTYTLRVVGAPGVDPLYAALPFTFDSGIVRLTDCASDDAAPVVVAPAPHIDYLAKDYATFRRLLLDRASLVMPEWNEGHVPDLNLTLLELLAYAGDYLSYLQDAVATEAYLATARKRVSVRRHARLLDYHMHDGCNARAWLSISAGADAGPLDPRELSFTTDATASEPAHTFEPLDRAPIVLHAAHDAIRLYAWGNRHCTLPAGATSATLRDAWLAVDGATEAKRALEALEAGVHVLFEAVPYLLGDVRIAADPAQRHVVRLTHVRRAIDPLYDTPVVDVAWAAAQALPFALTVAIPDPANPSGAPVECSRVSANLIAVDHGTAVRSEMLPPVPAQPLGRYAPRLAQPDLTFAEPFARGATSLDARDPHRAQPQILELVTIDAQGHERHWLPAPDLLAFGPADARYVVEVDETGGATLRFGDGQCGRRPPAGAAVRVRYRTGNGTAGNVGAETIVNAVSTGDAGLRLRVRNPLPASGGTPPESVADVRALAPSASRLRTARAIAPDDYAAIAQRDPRVQRAAAIVRWSGSRTVIVVALDPLGTDDCDPQLIADVRATLDAVRRIGHEVRVTGARYVPLRLGLDVSLAPGYPAGRIRRALEDMLGSGAAPDGTRGLFHPDELSFGTVVAQSRIVARAMAIAGVQDARVVRLERLYAPTPGDVPSVLHPGPLEIMQLDADLARPERGVLELTLRGGR